MPTPTQSITQISQRLTTTSTLLLERSRILSLNLKPSAASQNLIIRNLTFVRDELSKVSDQVELEKSGLVVGGGSAAGKNKGKSGRKGESEVDRGIRDCEERYDRLLEMFGEDEIGREKVKGLHRERKLPPSPISSPIPPQPKPSPIPENALPKFSVEPPSPAVDGPFRDYPDEPNKGEDEEDDGRTPHEMLSEQQQLMDDQDERLNLLSNSINRQNHLSIQIGSELDVHHDLLDDTDQAMDRTQARLLKARKRLDKVAREAKQYGSTITIVALIFILLILIIVFKT